MFTTKRLMGMAMALAVCLLSGVGVADAAAATGDLVQKPGAAGCLSMIGFCERGDALDGAESIRSVPTGRMPMSPLRNDAVAVFDRAGDGTLVQKPGPAGCISDTGAGRCHDGTALDWPQSVAISPDGQSVYVTSGGFSDAVAVFDRTPGGRLVQKPGYSGLHLESRGGPVRQGQALDCPQSVTVSPDGTSVYVACIADDAGVAVFDRAEDGALTQKPGTAGCISETGAGRAPTGGPLSTPARW